MPDLQTLSRIGFRGYPLWWKQRSFKQPPKTQTKSNIFAQQSDNDGSSGDEDSKTTFPLPGRLSSAITTATSQRTSSFGSTSQIIQEIPDLIDFEPTSPEQIGRKTPQAAPARKFIQFNDNNESNMQPSITARGSLASPSWPSYPFTSWPNGPHPTPATSPEQKPVNPFRDREHRRDPDSADLSTSKIADAQVLHSVKARVPIVRVVTSSPLETASSYHLGVEIESQKNGGYQTDQAPRAGRGRASAEEVNPREQIGLKFSRYEISSDSDEAKGPAGTSLRN